MNSDVFNRLKDLIISIVPLSFIAAYCFTIGFYMAQGIDVATFLTIEDLTFDAIRWIAGAFFYALVLTGLLASFFSDDQNSILNKTVGRSNIYWRFVVVSVIAVVVTLLSFIYTIVQDILSIVTAVVLVIGILLMIISILLTKIESDQKWKISDWAMVALMSVIFVCVIPFSGGAYYSNSKSEQKVCITLDDSTIVKSNSDLIYLGKTSNYFFIKNKKSKNVSAYSMDKVKSFEFLVDEK